MTEDEARNFVRQRFGVPRETLCARFADMVVEECSLQNLVSSATLASIWDRHIADSAQLVDLARNDATSWFDIGSGAGFPGMIVAILSSAKVTMVEPRRKRAIFLDKAITALGLNNVDVVQRRAERLKGTADVISARALAPLSETFRLAHALSNASTTWLLPRGRTAEDELEFAQLFWQGEFHVKRSLTDLDAFIVIARDVRPI